MSGTGTMTRPFGERLREARERTGLTQADVGAFLDASKFTVRMWETGRNGVTHIPVGPVLDRAEMFIMRANSDPVAAAEMVRNRPAASEVKEYSGADVQRLREQMGLTAIEFARLLQVSAETITRWEHETPSPNGSGPRKPSFRARRIMMQLEREQAAKAG